MLSLVRLSGLQRGDAAVDTLPQFKQPRRLMRVVGHGDRLNQTALKQGRSVNYNKLGKAYVESLMESVRFYADVGEQHLGLSPAHTLLLHENDLAAMFIGDLIRALSVEGWTIIDARKAYEDPIAKVVTDTLFNGQGRVAAMARVKGVIPRDLVHRAEDTSYLKQYFDERDVFGPIKK